MEVRNGMEEDGNTAVDLGTNKTNEEWINSTVVKVGEMVGVSFSVGCSCTSARLKALHQKSNIELHGVSSEAMEGCALEDNLEGIALDYNE